MRDRSRELEEANEKLAEARTKGAEVLQKTMPQAVAIRLLEEGRGPPVLYQPVTLLSCGLANYAHNSTRLEPAKLVDELNELYQTFDGIAQTHGCERIRTLAGTYLCACGLPEENPEHVRKIVLTAAAMRQHLKDRNGKGEVEWLPRFAIHTGSVLEAMVGGDKFNYDLLGDPVADVDRMQKALEPFEIALSTKALAEVEADFAFGDERELPLTGGALTVRHLRKL